MSITNYKIIKFEYKLNLNVGEKLLIIFIFKKKKYIVTARALLRLLSEMLN